MAAPAVASPSRATPTDIPTAAPSPASPPRRLASAPPAVDASGSSSPASAHSGDQLSAPDASSPLLASRSEEYRLLFRLPPDEVLVQDFNCAVQENILLQGHMYLFLHHICFYSNIFGYETKKCPDIVPVFQKTIPLQEVTDVRKAKTAAIFHNAIEIVAGSRRHFFGSFLSRDEAYRIIVDGWEQHVSDARLLLERQETKSASSSEENGYVVLEGTKESKQDGDLSLPDRSVNSTAVSSSNADGGDSNINISKRFSEVEENGLEDNIVALNPFNLEPVDAPPSVPESYTMISESKFQVPVEVLFNFLLSDGAFGFVDDFHTKCGDKEFSCSKWRTDEQGGLVRDVSFLHPIKIYLGAKFGTCQEVQKLRLYKNRRLVIQTSQSIGDAPYGDHFTVEGIWDVEQDSLDENCCDLRIYINVAFSKKTIFRGKIEQSTKDECREVFSLWIKLVCLFSYLKIFLSATFHLEGHDLLKQEYDRSKGASSTPDSGVQPGATTNEESAVEVAVPVVTIIVLLTRPPQVQMDPHGIWTGSSGYSKESIEWVQKRLSLLSEEMQLAEAHMETMRREFAWLRSYLERLQRTRGST
ncbi:Protein VASCULAR ASSOCIATED DEATH 1 chloroplastic [Zea mays]|uniref:Protein VASCULAR ASSOCIATED DEATH 1 chloroplastic n=1 Tax=Zea mays TaxID=4577 RepID=A0A1D6IBU9_MAIZE|nr:Protein VASCULAR ASSOCIATED DEATH 1 chloroplastic [Zea mays]